MNLQGSQWRKEKTMKNKKNIYFLLPAVLIIWGLLIYKVVRGVNPANNQVQSEVIAREFKPILQKESESFSIQADYRDPFLGILEKKKVPKSPKIIKQAVKKEIVPFPQVIYKGIIAPKGDDEPVFMIVVNERHYLYKKNETHAEVKLVSGNSEQIVLRFQRQQQIVALSQ